MSEWMAPVFSRFRLGRDPLDDPLDASWDAIVGHGREESARIDPGDLAVLQRLHLLESVPVPSPDFLGKLEHRLTALYPPPHPNPEPLPWERAPRASATKPSTSWSWPIPRQPRARSVHGALAALSLLVIVSLLVVFLAAPHASEPPIIPAATKPAPTLETLVQLDFDPASWGIVDASTSTYLNFNLVQIDPRKTFTNDVEWYTMADGPVLILVQSGELSIEPAGPATLYPAGHGGQESESIPAGQQLLLRTGDGIVFAAVDGVTGSNPGTDSALAIVGDVGHVTSNSNSGPVDMTNLDTQSDYAVHSVLNGKTSISIRRLRLEPFDSYVFEPQAGWTYLALFDQFKMDGVRLAVGAIDALTPDVETTRLYSSNQLTYPDPGPHTIINTGDTTVEIDFLVIEPVPSPATPSPVP